MYLTNHKNALPLFEWISRLCDVYLWSERLDIPVLERFKPALVISYNYIHLVSKECIDYMKGNVINLHISFLPWNRGASPNLWSFIENTPKGVTIHKMSEGLDEGDIIFQKELCFDAGSETFESTYQKLNDEIVTLFKEHWDEICHGTYEKYVHAQEGTGSYHTKEDLKKLKERIDFAWSDNIQDFLERYRVRM